MDCGSCRRSGLRPRRFAEPHVRPGLGIADALSAYMGYHPEPGKTDAERDLICMITRHGGTTPLEAGAYVVELIKKTLKYQASGVRLRELSASDN